MVYQNGNAIAMSLAPSGGISQDIYSTEELVIGQWIDGKPLYRRVLTGTVPSNLSAGLVIDSDLSKTYRFISGTVTEISGSSEMIPSYRMSDSKVSFKVTFNMANGLMMYSATNLYANGTFNICVEYTKTTDTATIKTTSINLSEASIASDSMASCPVSAANTVPAATTSTVLVENVEFKNIET